MPDLTSHEIVDPLTDEVLPISAGSLIAELRAQLIASRAENAELRDTIAHIDDIGKDQENTIEHFRRVEDSLLTENAKLRADQEPHQSKECGEFAAKSPELDALLDRLNRATNKVVRWRYEQWVADSLHTLQEEKRAARQSIESFVTALIEENKRLREDLDKAILAEIPNQPQLTPEEAAQLLAVLNQLNQNCVLWGL